MGKVWEYKVEQFPDNYKDCETRLNQLGAIGWEFCGRQGIHMIMKRIKPKTLIEEIIK